jgi:hypothetical protein
VIGAVALHCGRSLGEARAFVEALDREALEGGCRITRRMVLRAAAALGGFDFETSEEPGEGGRQDDR